MELAGQRPQGVEFFLELTGLTTATKLQGGQAVVRMDDQPTFFVAAGCRVTSWP